MVTQLGIMILDKTMITIYDNNLSQYNIPTVKNMNTVSRSNKFHFVAIGQKLSEQRGSEANVRGYISST